jgi:hypothetical protein
MALSRTVSKYLLSASVVLVPLWIGSACTSETASSQDAGPTTDAVANPDSLAPDTSVIPSPDASPDARGDGAVDAGPCTTYPDGKYTWGIWTCTSGARTTDVKAFAMGIGIQSVDTTFTGTTGVVDVGYSGGAVCTRSTTLALVYPSCGMVTNTTATTYTCSATCDAAKCTSGAQAATVQTYALSRTGDTFTTTRTLDAATVQGLQALAGCQPGDLETATILKQ